MGRRNGGGAGGGKANGKGGGGGGNAGAWGSAARQAPGTWVPQAPAAWTGQNFGQTGGWGQPSRGWSQHPHAADWAYPDQAWGRAGWRGNPQGARGFGPVADRQTTGRGGPYSGGDRPGRTGGPGLWQGLQDVTAAARVAIDAAREFRSFGAPASGPAPGQALETGDGCAGRGWLSSVRSWLLGDQPSAGAAPPTGAAQPPSASAQVQAGPDPNPDYAVLLGRLLGAGPPAGRVPDPQNPDVARLTAELARQQRLLALLVDRVAAPAGPQQAAAQAGVPPAPLTGVAALDPTTEALLEELRSLRASVGDRVLPVALAPREPLEEGEAVEAPPSALARPPPPLSAFDPEGDVSQAGAEAFWAWLDVTPRATWAGKAPYGEWAAKVVYKCTAAELLAWATKFAPQQLEGHTGHQSKRDILDALARACAAGARATACSGPAGSAPTAAAGRPSVLDRLQAAPRAAV